MTLITDIAASMPTSGDDSLDYMRINLAMRGFDYELVKKVEIDKMPIFLAIKLKDRVQHRACYHIALEAVKILKSRAGITKYVLGFWDSIIPLEHAFLRVGDEYYDPTGELLHSADKHEYYTVFELFRTEVQEVARHMRINHGYRDAITMYEVMRYLVEVGPIGGYSLASRGLASLKSTYLKSTEEEACSPEEENGGTESP